MNDSTVCPECRRPIPANSPAGLCPDCLLAQGFGPAAPGDAARAAGAAFAVTTPQSGRVIAPDPAELAPHFPQLEILELIGQGGMGAVYKARQRKLDRLVAVKIIRPEISDDPSFAERFMREAKTLARLSHPNIVGVHDFGEIRMDGLPAVRSGAKGSDDRLMFYFIMEYVDGVNLRQLMESKQLPPELAIRIVPQVCEALQFAHDEGVVHRDIKPENIMLDTRGRVKIADFGLAKLAGRTSDEFTLTGTHQVMGTPRYMAPEQMSGSRDVDHRSDIFSLGVVFYEMLTGDIPAGHFAPPSEKSGLDVRWDEVVLRAMAREPNRRFQSARELRSDVEKISSITAQSDGNAVIPPGTRTAGLSTIIDREVLGAWQLVTGNETATDRRTKFPVMMMLLLCIAGVACLLLPWIEVKVTPEDRRIGSAGLEPLSEGVPELSEYHWCQTSDFQESPKSPIDADSPRTFRGLDLKTGMISGVCLALMAILLVGIPERLQVTVAATLPILGLSLVTLLCVVLAFFEVQNVRFHVVESAADQKAQTGEPRNTLPESDSFAINSDRPQWHTTVSGQFAEVSHGSADQANWIVDQDNAASPAHFQLCVLQSAASSEDSMLTEPAGYYREISILPTWYAPIGVAGILLLFSGASVRQAVCFGTFGSRNPVQRTDSVVTNRQSAESGRLPDVCMVCGCEAHERVGIKISHQPEWAQGLMLLGFICGGVPGVIIGIVTSTEIRVSCPICPGHRNHWSRLVLYASTGWLLPFILAGVGFVIGAAVEPSLDTLGPLGLVIGAVIGVVLYLGPVIYLASTNVKCEVIDKDKLTFSRIASAFARAVRQKQSEASPV